MTLKRLILLLMILPICCIAKSQDTTKATLHVDTIKYVTKSEKFYLNNKKLQVGDMKPMLLKYNSSAFEFKQYQKRATPGTIILLTGLTSGVIALTRLNKDKQFFTPYTITLFAGDLIGIPLMIWAKKHLRKSVRLYNKEILKDFK
jgi:hypothetical protein